MIEAVERVEMSAFKVNHRGTGSAQYHPRMMLALLIYCYANGILSRAGVIELDDRCIAGHELGLICVPLALDRYEQPKLSLSSQSKSYSI